MKPINPDDKMKGAVLIGATVLVFIFIGFQVYGQIAPQPKAPTGAATAVGLDGQPVKVASNGPTATAAAKPQMVRVSGMPTAQRDPFKTTVSPADDKASSRPLDNPGIPPSPALDKPGPLPGVMPTGGVSPTGAIGGGGVAPAIIPSPEGGMSGPVYKGGIFGKRRSAVISVNGQDLVIKEGAAAQGIRVVSVQKDVALVRVTGIKSTIRLKADSVK